MDSESANILFLRSIHNYYVYTIAVLIRILVKTIKLLTKMKKVLNGPTWKSSDISSRKK